MKQFVSDFKIVLIIMALLIGFCAYRIVDKEIEKANSKQVEQYCVVEDKYTKSVLIGKVVTRRYVLDVSVIDAEELKDSVMVSSDVYNQIEKGTEIKCILYYTNDKLVDIEVAY